jgi:hypothetical protein
MLRRRPSRGFLQYARRIAFDQEKVRAPEVDVPVGHRPDMLKRKQTLRDSTPVATSASSDF